MVFPCYRKRAALDMARFKHMMSDVLTRRKSVPRGEGFRMTDAALTDRRMLLGGAAALLAGANVPSATAAAIAAGAYEDVRRYGAKGDGKTIDSNAINRAIAAAAKQGGGTVLVPPGRYLCFSIRLQDNITLALSAGATIIAASPDEHGGHYDAPENYLEEQFQDYGITHIHNSLIYADGASNIGIIGPGLFHGLGLDRDGPGERWHGKGKWESARALGITPKEAALRNPEERKVIGRGNKTIGLMNCRNVRLGGFTVLQGGHFCVMAHGCSNMQIEGLMIDTDRDGIDIDCCRDVSVLNCTVNSPKDDAIVIKSSYALGRAVVTEDVTIANCKTSGYLMGSVLDGTYQRSPYGRDGDGTGPLGRIKLGTESNGGFRNIRITDCTCSDSRGILMGCVDGGTLEDVTVSGIMLRNPTNNPLFVHHGARMRAPLGTPLGAIRRVRFEDITIAGADPRYPIGVEGLRDGMIEDVTFSDIEMASGGGGTAEDAAREPEYRRETSLEVSYLKTLPASGVYARNAKRLTLRNLAFHTDKADARPTVALFNVEGAIIDGIASPASRTDTVRATGSKDVAIGSVTTRD
jgi:polygalacturonase